MSNLNNPADQSNVNDCHTVTKITEETDIGETSISEINLQYDVGDCIVIDEIGANKVDLKRDIDGCITDGEVSVSEIDLKRNIFDGEISVSEIDMERDTDGCITTGEVRETNLRSDVETLSDNEHIIEVVDLVLDSSDCENEFVVEANDEKERSLEEIQSEIKHETLVDRCFEMYMLMNMKCYEYKQNAYSDYWSLQDEFHRRFCTFVTRPTNSLPMKKALGDIFKFMAKTCWLASVCWVYLIRYTAYHKLHEVLFQVCARLHKYRSNGKKSFHDTSR